MSAPLFKNALRDAGKLYFMMVMSGVTSLTLVMIVVLAVVFAIPANEQMTAKIGTKQDLLQWHQQEADKLKKDLQQK